MISHLTTLTSIIKGAEYEEELQLCDQQLPLRKSPPKTETCVKGLISLVLFMMSDLSTKEGWEVHGAERTSDRRTKNV